MTSSPLRTIVSLLLFGAVAAVTLVGTVLASHLLRNPIIEILPELGDEAMGAPFFDVLANDWAFALAMGVATLLITKRFLGRPGHPLALPNRRSGAEILIGLALGSIPALIVGVAYALTGATIEIAAPDAGSVMTALGVGILLLFPAALAEEWLFRDYTLSALTPHVGAPWAIFASSLVFAAAHWTNPGGASWLAMADVLVAGVGLGLAYTVTRSLWVATTWHFAWNFSIGVVLGLPISGFPVDSWLRITPDGPWWWTGGEFGPEASVLSLGADVVAVAVFAVVAILVPRENWSGPGVDTSEAQT
jgi:membrane protease YdiL (CAAX protease family)